LRASRRRRRQFEGFDPNGWIFPSPHGGPIRRTNWRRRFWLPAVESTVGLPFRFQDLRHSHAAMLIAQGEHPKVIADRLGHANPMVTMTTYAHLFDGLDVAAAERLDDARTRSVTDPGRTPTVPAPILLHP
jgi:integrase